MDFLRKEKERVRAACFESWLDRGPIPDGLETALRDAVDFFNQGRDAKGGSAIGACMQGNLFYVKYRPQSLPAAASSSAWTPSVTCRPPPPPPPASPSTTRADTPDSSPRTWDQL